MRFTILQHTGVPSPHFDLLIETDPQDLLLTFRLEQWPIASPADVARQPDHRRIYLDYQGPISGNRGQVRQVASGQYSKAMLTPSAIDITLDLNPPVRLSLREVQADHWHLTTG